mmetsp:Transcript_51950/g.123677  ORF Transcript_51950/g.123677 Transcript_51950/m.123677 type:complete len:106 (+) Transcript_51950:1628-1945(+)
MKLLRLALVLHLYHGLVFRPSHYLEGPVLHVSLNAGVFKFPANKPLGIVHCASWVSGSLTLGGITNKALSFSERHIRRSGAFSLGILDNLRSTTLPHANAREGRP